METLTGVRYSRAFGRLLLAICASERRRTLDELLLRAFGLNQNRRIIQVTHAP